MAQFLRDEGIKQAKQAKELGLMTKNSQRRSNPNEIPIA